MADLQAARHDDRRRRNQHQHDRYAYDNNGNLLTAGTSTYSWNYRNRLLTVGNGLATSSYSYDHADSRVMTSDGGVTTYLPNQYFSATATSTTKHLFALGLPIATIDSDLRLKRHEFCKHRPRRHHDQHHQRLRRRPGHEDLVTHHQRAPTASSSSLPYLARRGRHRHHHLRLLWRPSPHQSHLHTAWSALPKKSGTSWILLQAPTRSLSR